MKKPVLIEICNTAANPLIPVICCEFRLFSGLIQNFQGSSGHQQIQWSHNNFATL